MKNKLRIMKIIIAALSLVVVGLGTFVGVQAFTPKTEYVTVSFESGGNAINDLILEENSKVQHLETPYKEGHIFKGWYIDQLLQYPFNKESFDVIEDITLYGKWERSKYYVIYQTFGGSSIPTYLTDYGTRVSDLPFTTNRQGFSFGGWYLDSELLFPASDAVVNNNITLYAKWNPGEVSIVYDSLGGDIFETINYLVNTQLTEIPIPVRSGYEFLGWYSLENPQRLYTTFIIVDKNYQLFAKWESLKHSVIFNTDGGTVISDLEVNSGTSLMDLPRPTKEGFVFEGWYLDSSFETKLDATYVVTSDITIYAKWGLNQSVISFETNGGNDILPLALADGSKLNNLPVPRRTGYRFLGWYYDQTLLDLVKNTDLIFEDITIYANWERQSYTVTYNTGIQGFTIPSKTILYLEPIVADPFELENYTFLGWYTNSEKTIKFVDGQVVRSDITLYAKIEKTVHTISFNTMGGSTISNKLVDENDSISNLNNPTKLGHTFMGWYLEENYQTSFNLNNKIHSSFTLYAKWSLNLYKLIYQSSETTSTELDLFYGETILSIPDPTKVGEHFTGWYIGDTLSTYTTMPAHNLLLVAKFEPNVYEFKFDLMGAPGAIPTINRLHEEILATSEPLIRYTGYSLDGWYLDLNDQNSRFEFDYNYVMTSNITVYAKWKPNPRTISYYKDDGVTVNNTVDYGYQERIISLNLAKEGYTFAGWYTDSNLTNLFNLEFMPDYNLSLYPKFVINEYRIIFDSVDLPDLVFEYNGILGVLPNPNRSGFTFNGWYLDKALSQRFELSRMPNNNITVYANWVVNESTIGFETDGGTYIESITGNVGDTVTAPSDPVKLGYEFKGWYSDQRFTDKYSFTTLPSEGIVLYAKFDRLLYTIHFEANTYDYVEDLSLPYNALITELPNPIKEGYVFAGWYMDSNLTQRFSLTTMPYENIVLYARWEITYYKLAFESVYEIPTIIAKYGDPITAPLSPTKLGYTFDGWYSDFSLTQKFEFTSMPDRNVLLYAKFVVNNFEIYFETNGGVEVDPITLNYNELISITQTTSKEGHTYIGWYMDSNLTRPFNLTTMPNQSITLYARFQVNQYVVSFVSDEVVNRTFNYGAVINYLPPTKVGYSFLGWYLDEAKLIEKPETMPANALILYAKYQINTYSIKFNSNGGTVYDNVVLEYNTLFTPPTPQRVGYTFDGWFTNSNLTTRYTSNRITAANITLYAKWVVNQYKISFTTNGPIVNDILYNYNANLQAFSAITKTGYTFKGWYMDQAYTEEFNLTKMPANDIRVYAKWEINEYTITFNSNGGTDVLPITADYNTELEAPLNPTRVGYTFRGWYSNSNLTSIYNFTSMPAANITLYAKWEINEYRLSFITYTDSISDIFYEYNEQIREFETLSRSGYTFMGWFLDSNFTQSYNLTNMPGRNVVVYAKWQINQYTITFNSNQGSSIENQVLNFNANIPQLENPTRLGYTFKGWYTNEALTNSFNLSNMPSNNITLYAKWEINTFKVVFRTNIGIVIEDRIYDYNQFIESIPVLEEYGNTFLGWYLPNGQRFEVSNDNTYRITSDIVLNARWQKASFTITFNSNGGSDVDSITQDFNTLVNEPTNPTKDKYNFAGWFTDPELTKNYYFSRMSGENVTLYAKWIRVADLTVTYILNNGEDNIINTFNPSEITTLLVNPVIQKLGYTFNGWYMDLEFSKPALTNLPDYDITLYAKWTINKYTITFNLDGGTGTNSITKNYDEALVAPSNPTKVGYTFIGWYSTNSFDQVYVFDKMKSYNETVYAKFEINKYVIKTYPNNGSVVSDIELEYNALIGNLMSVVKEGYTFNGWYLDSNFTQIYNLTNMPARNIELHAKFTINKYTISFVAEGLNINSINYNYNELISEFNVVNKVGYTFVGWYLDQEFNQEFNLTNMPANNVTVYAKYEVNEYTITFDSKEGTEVLPITADYNTAITKPTDPTKEGYSFAGWYLGNQAYQFNKMGAENIVLVARWNKVPELLFMTTNTHFYLLETEGVTLRVKALDDDLSNVTMVFNIAGTNLTVKLNASQTNTITSSINGITATYDVTNQEWIVVISSQSINENFRGQVVTVNAKVNDIFGHNVAEVIRTYSFNVTNAPVVSYVTPSTPVNLVNNEFIYELDVTSTELSIIRLDTNVFGRINIFADELNPYGSLSNQNRLNALGIFVEYQFNETTNQNHITVRFNEEATYQISNYSKFIVDMSIEDTIGNEIFISNEYVIKK